MFFAQPLFYTDGCLLAPLSDVSKVTECLTAECRGDLVTIFDFFFKAESFSLKFLIHNNNLFLTVTFYITYYIITYFWYKFQLQTSNVYYRYNDGKLNYKAQKHIATNQRQYAWAKTILKFKKTILPGLVCILILNVY